MNYTPHVFFDGIVDGEFGGPWEQMILDRATVESPLRIELAGDPGAGTITATITNTSAFPVNGFVRFVIVENGIVVGGNPQEHAMRDMIPDATGTPISLQPAEQTVEIKNYTLDPSWVEENLECVVFVQNDTTTEIYQTAKIFFLLDQPELLASELNVDDTATGNGDGFFDPGETIDLSVVLANLNPVDALNVTGTIASGDANAILVDDAGSWPDIPGGGQGENTADTFVLGADENTPWGHLLPITLSLASDPGYTKEILFKLGIGQPLNPIGPDAFGYYCYEALDSYVPSPTFDWVEIDPGLGGAGTIVTLGDDQTVNRTVPFEWKLYGNVSDRVSICSNGFIALGITTNREFNGNIPGPEGPPNMVAGFWTDLNPASPDGGKIYEWYDAAGGRYIIEFSGVEHYDDANNGPPETFQFIIYDPTVHPTQTGDSQVDIQYLLVSEPSSCSVGIENGDETIGTEYQASGTVNVAAHGIADGRVMRYTTTGPDGVVGVGDPAVAPVALSLVARPNPFRAGATIHYAVPSSGAGQLRIFTPDGVLVRTLLDGALAAGQGSVLWDGRNETGVNMPAGMYLYRLSGDGYNATGKLVRLR